MEAAFTERELDVMDVLWELEDATVAEVRERLADELAYTTVLTVLRTLEAKGHVAHVEEGKAYRYRALVGREAAGRSALKRLVRKVFRGSPELLLTQLVSDRGVSRAELEGMRRLLEERLDGAGVRARPAAAERGATDAGPVRWPTDTGAARDVSGEEEP